MSCGKRNQKLEDFQYHEEVKEHQGLIWDGIFNLFIKKKFKVQITKQLINYISEDGQILRTDQRNDCHHEILTNLDQIYHLQCIYEQNPNKAKTSNFMWKGETIQNIEGECCTYVRIKTKFLYRVYQQLLEVQLGLIFLKSLAQVYYAGIYHNEQRIGRWQYYYQNSAIGGGTYNNLGIKIGKWVELSENFWNYSQVTLQGEYKNGKKFGRWVYNYKLSYSHIYHMEIGHGLYDEHNQKTGIWIEPSNEFSQSNNITFCGEYINGKKIGRWKTYWMMENDKIIQMYKNQKYFFKFIFQWGRLLQLSEPEKWEMDRIELYIQQRGQVYMSRLILGWQKNWALGFYLLEYNRVKKNKLLKFKVAVVYMMSKISKMVNGLNSVIISLMKVRFFLQDNINKEKKSVNGTSNLDYMILLNGCKLIFYYFCGGGQYDEDNLKDGEWTELNDNFHNFSQIFWYGKFRKGQKIERWNCYYEGDLIGSGLYDDDNLKNGKWLEPSDNYQYYRQIKFEGKYRNGKKIGKWDLYWRGERYYQDFEWIGGGYYNEQSVKIGTWIEISDDFQKSRQIIYKGQYENGKKVQLWGTLWRDEVESQFQKIGGGQYNEEGMKNGRWIELNNQFEMQKLIYNDLYSRGSRVFHIGKYNKSLKVDYWEIYFYQSEERFQLIGGGLYDDEKGQKNGVWNEQDHNFWSCKYSIWIGEYQQAKKIGNWVKMSRDQISLEFQRDGEYQFNN